jgi:hypothetical protein
MKVLLAPVTPAPNVLWSHHSKVSCRLLQREGQQSRQHAMQHPQQLQQAGCAANMDARSAAAVHGMPCRSNDQNDAQPRRCLVGCAWLQPALGKGATRCDSQRLSYYDAT